MKKAILGLSLAALLTSACGQNKDTNSKTNSESAKDGAISLRSTDGSDISVDYFTFTNESQWYRKTYAEDAIVKASNPSWRDATNDARIVVVMVKAGLTFNCKATDVGGGMIQAKVPEDCTVEGDAYSRKYFGELTSLPMMFTGHGLYENWNDYQLAIVRNNKWLEDPINGTHNFNFKF